jgi:hypothetical protein
VVERAENILPGCVERGNSTHLPVRQRLRKEDDGDADGVAGADGGAAAEAGAAGGAAADDEWPNMADMIFPKMLIPIPPGLKRIRSCCG